PQRMQADLAQLDRARRNDLAQVERYVPEDFRESGELGVDIMVAAVRHQIERIQDYLDQGRRLADYTVVAPESDRIRGVDHDLQLDDRPAVMIRRCEIGGTMRADGTLYAVTGILENLTPSPELLAEPTRARLRLEGPELIRLEYVCDRRDQQAIDLITLHWPQRQAKPMRLGDQEDAGIMIQGGQRELWVQVRKENDRIEGRLVSKQTGVNLDLSVDPRYATSAAVVSLQESLAAVDRIEVDAHFEGTWRDLDLNLNTNLGRILREAANEAIAGQVRAAKLQLANTIDETYRAQIGELQQWLGSRQSEARELVASADKSIEEMSQKVLDEVGDADAYLGRLRGAIRGRLK
ncbi:MAG: TIGR03545 family protein, partial [Planctomycetes bacterium]|nr:TIGR03545 family protein [Planctomycetota bacterium]